jgi:acetolactate synthase-1/2/3 large subunit
MKLSDYVIDFFVKRGITHFFVMTGGAAAHLIDSVGEHPNCEYLCFNHEQAAAMAADSYTKVRGIPAVTIATSGPGAINLFTGIACSYYDSIPTIHLTGNVSTFRSSMETSLRQLGFQESRIVEMAQHITKRAFYVADHQDIRKILEEAWFLSLDARPGPVLLDIPDNIQRMEIEPDKLEGFTQINRTEIKGSQSDYPFINSDGEQVIKVLESAERPVLVLGAGINKSETTRRLARTLVHHWKIPTLFSWATLDLLPTDDPYNAGNFGTHGTRFGNFTVQNCDAVISIGCRLDTHATGSPVKNFARAAKKVICDIDAAELKKFRDYGMEADLFEVDSQQVLAALLALDPPNKDYSKWWNRVRNWKITYPARKFAEDSEYVNPFRLMGKIGSAADKDAIFVIDSSACLPQAFHGIKLREGQRMITSLNNSPMGYALPGAIGAWKATGKQIIAIQGDGAFQINIQELALLKKWNMNIKLIVLDNKGYSMIKETQNQWLDNRYHGANEKQGLAFPDFLKIAEAYEIAPRGVYNNDELFKLEFNKSPELYNIRLNPDKTEFPITLYGKPIEDLSPYLSKEELKENMIIPVLE